MRLTKQGVRDLGGNARVRQPQVLVGCRHLWEEFWDWDCDRGVPLRRKYCGFCQVVV